MKVIHSKNVLINGQFKEAYVQVDNGVIKGIQTTSNSDNVIDYKEDYVVAGFIDIHTHGALNVDFADASPDEIIKAVKYHLTNGVTGILPTITSSTVPKILQALENVKIAMQDSEYGKCILGVHLEGPYLSQNQSGAQEKSLITEPIENDYKKIVNEYGDIIKRWDYAPERDNNGKFCKYLKENNIIPSAGHTDAKYSDMVVAKENGCNLITHFYSCTSTITREQGVRILGVLECGYLWDDMYVEIIADGKHLPNELLQLIFKLKNHDKIILISDSLKVAGSNEKYSSVGNVKCIIEDGVCKLLDRTAFAGSIASGVQLIKTCIKAGLKVEEAVKMFTENPANLLQENSGEIAVGKSADFVVMDKDCEIKQVMLKGEIIK